MDKVLEGLAAEISRRRGAPFASGGDYRRARELVEILEASHCEINPAGTMEALKEAHGMTCAKETRGLFGRIDAIIKKGEADG